MKKYMRVCADIDLDNIYRNITLMRSLICRETKMIPVIKADGYGHGAVPIAEMLEPEEFIWGAYYWLTESDGDDIIFPLSFQIGRAHV